MELALLEAIQAQIAHLAFNLRRLFRGSLDKLFLPIEHGVASAVRVAGACRSHGLRSAAVRAAGLASACDLGLLGTALDGFEVWRGEIAFSAISGSALPPFGGVSERVGFA